MSTSATHFSLDLCVACELASYCHGDPERTANGARTVLAAQRLMRKGSWLFRPGDSFEGLYFVRSGTLKTSMVTVEGEERVTGFYTTGDYLGFEALATGEHRTSAVALDTSSLCLIDIDRLGRDGAAPAGLYQTILTSACRALDRTQMQSSELGHKSADERLAGFLLMLAGRQAERGYSPYEVRLAMPRTDIASYLGLAAETVSRCLARLRDADIVQVDRHRVVVDDMDALAAVAGKGAPRAPARPGCRSVEVHRPAAMLM